MTGFAHLETATESIFSAQNSWISDRFLTAAKEVRPVCDARPDDVKGIVCLVMFEVQLFHVRNARQTKICWLCRFFCSGEQETKHHNFGFYQCFGMFTRDIKHKTCLCRHIMKTKRFEVKFIWMYKGKSISYRSCTLWKNIFEVNLRLLEC